MMPTDPDRLMRFECFHNLTEEQLAAVAEMAEEECFYPQTELFSEGAPGRRIYLLSQGEVEILYSIGEAGPTQVDTMGAGEILGCSSLVEPYLYSSEARCLTQIEAMILDAENLRKLMKEDCQLGLAIQAEIMRMLLDQITDLRLGM